MRMFLNDIQIVEIIGEFSASFGTFRRFLFNDLIVRQLIILNNLLLNFSFFFNATLMLSFA